MDFTRENDERRNRPALGVNALDHGNPFSIPRLYRFRLSASICARNDGGGGDLAHHKPSLVKVVDVSLLDAVFCNCVLYKREPTTNDLWVFALGPLIVVLST